jgi:hypothetical protein
MRHGLEADAVISCVARTTHHQRGDIYPVIRSRAGGSDEARRGLCYDTPHIEAMPFLVGMPDKTLGCYRQCSGKRALR